MARASKSELPTQVVVTPPTEWQGFRRILAYIVVVALVIAAIVHMFLGPCYGQHNWAKHLQRVNYLNDNGYKRHQAFRICKRCGAVELVGYSEDVAFEGVLFWLRVPVPVDK